MKASGRPGPKQKISSEAWTWLSVRLPDDFGQALKLFCLRKRTKQATLLRDMIEKLLVQEGYLKVTSTKGPDGEVRSYEFLDR